MIFLKYTRLKMAKFLSDYDKKRSSPFQTMGRRTPCCHPNCCRIAATLWYDKVYRPLTFIKYSKSGKVCPSHRFTPTTDSLTNFHTVAFLIVIFTYYRLLPDDLQVEIIINTYFTFIYYNRVNVQFHTLIYCGITI